MSAFLSALALAERLPPIVRKAEDFAHVKGMPPANVALAMRLPIAEVVAHLNLAKAVRQIIADAASDKAVDSHARGEAAANVWRRHVLESRRQAGTVPAASRPRVSVVSPSISEPIAAYVTPTTPGKFRKPEPGIRDQMVALAVQGVRPTEIGRIMGRDPDAVSAMLSAARRLGITVPKFDRKGTVAMRRAIDAPPETEKLIQDLRNAALLASRSRDIPVTQTLEWNAANAITRLTVMLTQGI